MLRSARLSQGSCAPLEGCLNSQLELWYASNSRTASCRVTVNGTARSFAGDGPGVPSWSGVGSCREAAPRGSVRRTARSQADAHQSDHGEAVLVQGLLADDALRRDAAGGCREAPRHQRERGFEIAVLMSAGSVTAGSRKASPCACPASLRVTSCCYVDSACRYPGADATQEPLLLSSWGSARAVAKLTKALGGAAVCPLMRAF